MEHGQAGGRPAAHLQLCLPLPYFSGGSELGFTQNTTGTTLGQQSHARWMFLAIWFPLCLFSNEKNTFMLVYLSDQTGRVFATPSYMQTE